MAQKMTRLTALALAAVLLTALMSGCGGTKGNGNTEAFQTTEENGNTEAFQTTEENGNIEVFRTKAESLRGAVLSAQVQGELVENPAGEAGNAVFISVCDSETRACVYSGTGDTPDAAWDAAVQAAETALEEGGPYPLWLKADLVYVSSPLSAAALGGIGEVFGAGNFRYGLAFDPAYGTALLEAELNSAGIYDYENGGVDLQQLNAYLEESGRTPRASLPEEYTAFQCAGWLCDEDGNVFQLSPDESDYGRRDLTVDGRTAAALALDGAEYLSKQTQEDGSIILDGGTLAIARHADALSAMIRGYQILPNESLGESIDRAAGWIVGQIAYSESGFAFLLDEDEITLEDSALCIIALADCAEVSGNENYVPVCQALGTGILSLLDSDTGTLTHVLDATSLGKKEALRSAQWDSMAATALCRLYGLTEDALWLWSAELVLDRMVGEETWQYGDVWTAYALREATKYVKDRADYFAFALKNAQGGLADVYGAQGTAPAGLEMLAVSYETYCEMLDAGYSAEGFEPDLLLAVLHSRAERQLDGYLFPEYAMYFAKPQQVLGAFMSREDGLCISADGLCRSIGGYYLYAANY